MYYVLMSLIGFACIVLGWDSADGLWVCYLSVMFGGMLLGHVLTLALNEEVVQ